MINKCPAAAEGRTRGEAKRKRVEAAPLYLRDRVERDEKLPEVEDVRVGGASEGSESDGAEEYKQEVLCAVVGFVVTELKAELVVELLQALKPRWSQRGV